MNGYRVVSMKSILGKNPIPGAFRVILERGNAEDDEPTLISGNYETCADFAWAMNAARKARLETNTREAR